VISPPSPRYPYQRANANCFGRSFQIGKGSHTETQRPTISTAYYQPIPFSPFPGSFPVLSTPRHQKIPLHSVSVWVVAHSLLAQLAITLEVPERSALAKRVLHLASRRLSQNCQKNVKSTVAILKGELELSGSQ
jgi:hypothetical protein